MTGMSSSQNCAVSKPCFQNLFPRQALVASRNNALKDCTRSRLRPTRGSGRPRRRRVAGSGIGGISLRSQRKEILALAHQEGRALAPREIRARSPPWADGRALRKALRTERGDEGWSRQSARARDGNRRKNAESGHSGPCRQGAHARRGGPGRRAAGGQARHQRRPGEPAHGFPGPARRGSQRPRKGSHGGQGASGRSRMRGTEDRGRRRPRRDPSHHAAKRRGRPARAESSQANPKAATDRGRAAMARRTSCTLSCLERHGGRVLPRIESRLRGEWAPRRVADGLGHRPKRPAASSRARFFPWTPRRPAPLLPAHGPLCPGKRCFGLSRDGNRPGAGVHAHERKTETGFFSTKNLTDCRRRQDP